MPDRTSKPKRPRDTNVLAKRIVDEATGDAPPPAEDQPKKNPAAVELGRLGGKKGGPAFDSALGELRAEYDSLYQIWTSTRSVEEGLRKATAELESRVGQQSP